MLSQLLADGVIADTNVTRVGEIDYLHSYFVHLSVVQRATQWKHRGCIHLGLFPIIKSGGPHAFGYFYNSLVLSDNRIPAGILREALDEACIKKSDAGEELYVIDT